MSCFSGNRRIEVGSTTFLPCNFITTSLRVLVLGACLTSALPRSVMAEEPHEEFDRKLAAGFEPASLLEDSTSADGRLSVLFTARKRTSNRRTGPRSFAMSSRVDQGVGADDYTEENWIVSLPEKKRLGVVRTISRRGTVDKTTAIFPCSGGRSRRVGVTGNGLSKPTQSPHRRHPQHPRPHQRAQRARCRP